MIRLFLALLGVLALAGGTPVRAAPDWVAYQHATLGFSISHPRGWEVLSGTGQAAFVAIGPEVPNLPGVRMVVAVVSTTLPPGATLHDAEASVQAFFARTGGPTTSILRQDRILLGGFPALITYVHRRNPQGVELYQMLMILAYKGRGYGVLGSTAVASPRLADDTAFLQSIILTFRPPP